MTVGILSHLQRQQRNFNLFGLNKMRLQLLKIQKAAVIGIKWILNQFTHKKMTGRVSSLGQSEWKLKRN